MALAAALVLAGCASDHGTGAMTQEQLEAIMRGATRAP